MMKRLFAAKASLKRRPEALCNQAGKAKRLRPADVYSATFGETCFSEVKNMSPKELLYIEDALGHETFLQSQCRQAAQALQNPELKNYVNQLADQHQQLFQKLYQLV